MIQSLKGMPDILPAESSHWQFVESRLRQVLQTFGFEEIRTPILEDTSLFVRSVGEHTDIVGKEMFSFVDQGGTQMSLRPEGTAPVIRAFQQHQLGKLNGLTKLFYIGPMFRHERPQKGRLRQFHQVGAESIGLFDPWVDVEMIQLVNEICSSFKIQTELEINSMGDQETRDHYREIVQKHFRNWIDSMSDNEKNRLESNPLRLLDSKNPALAEAIHTCPSILDHLNDSSKKFFDAVVNGLQKCGVHFRLNPRIVRGLDYYCHTTFEVTASGLGAQNSICGGGRYDRLSKSLGDQEIPAIGFGMGMERLLISLQNHLQVDFLKRIEVISLDEASKPTAFEITSNLRKDFRSEYTIDMQFDVKSFKSALKNADRKGTSWAIVIGENELTSKKALVKNLARSEQTHISFEDLTTYFRNQKK